jgi:DnaK suppressor protein
MNSFAPEYRPAVRTVPVALTPQQLRVLASQLEQQMQFRLEQIHEHDLISSPRGRAETEADREVSATLLRGALEALAEIEAARRRMADGHYGRCVDCAAALPIERLEVLPYVARCLPCHRAVAP